MSHATSFCHIHVACDIRVLLPHHVACDILLPQTRCMWHNIATFTWHVTYVCHITLHVTYFCHITLHVTYYCHKHVACDILLPHHVAYDILYNTHFAYYILTCVVYDMPHFVPYLCYKCIACDERTPQILCVWYATDTLHLTYLCTRNHNVLLVTCKKHILSSAMQDTRIWILKAWLYGYGIQSVLNQDILLSVTSKLWT